MTHEQIDKLWSQALQETTAAGDRLVRYHFADLLLSEKDAEIEHWKRLVFQMVKAKE